MMMRRVKFSLSTCDLVHMQLWRSHLHFMMNFHQHHHHRDPQHRPHHLREMVDSQAVGNPDPPNRGKRGGKTFPLWWRCLQHLQPRPLLEGKRGNPNRLHLGERGVR